MKALVIGLGRMGTFHARALASTGYDVETVDPDPAAGANHASLPRGQRHYSAIAIATPIEHLAPTAARVVRWTNNLLVEKPMASSIAEARELVAALEGRTIAVGYVERFNPQVLALRERVALAGVTVRQARFVRHNTRPTPSVPLDLESHDRDLARFLGVGEHALFDARGGASEMRREIHLEVETPTGELVNAFTDLTAHATSPLHAQWRALLDGDGGYATAADAVAVLEDLALPAAVA